MLKKYKTLIFLVIIIALIYLALNLIVPVFGKKIIIEQVENNLKRKVTLDKLYIGFPFSVILRGLEIENFLKADSVSLSPNILGFLAGKIVLSDVNLIRPLITVAMNQDGTLDIPLLPKGEGKQSPVILTGLRVRNGKVIFTDKKVSPEGYKVIFGDINVTISKVALPLTSLFTKFNISASLLDREDIRRGRFLSSGWIDFRPKNMDGKVELKDVDATYLAPYYGSIIPIKNLSSAKLNFNADLKAKNNDLLVKCHLEFSDVVYDKSLDKQGGGIPGIDLLPSLLNISAGPSGKIVFDFVNETKLDNPQLMNIQGTIAQAVVNNIASQPPGEFAGKVKDAAGEFKDLGKAMEDLFKKKEE